MENHLRLFIAIPLPEKVRIEIEKAQQELRSALPESRIRWTRHEQFHLTLRFLGNVEAARSEGLVEAVRSACDGFFALNLRAESIGCFPNLRRPRVLWSQIQDHEGELIRLQQRLQTVTQGFTAEAPEEKFSGHVTLGRVKELVRHESKTLAECVSNMAGKFFGEWKA